MQTAFLLKDTKRTEKQFPNSKIRLTKRDFDIFEFLLEMKFATVEDIQLKFFSKARDGSKSESLWWARERLLELRKHDFIQTMTLLSDRRNYFLPTGKGYRILSNTRVQKTFPRPLSKIDLGCFEHDHLVTKMRLQLEASGKIKSWVSERTLQLGRGIKAFTHRDSIPDGIFTTTENEEVIFELERSLKSIRRYREKIKRFVDQIRSTNHNFPRCQKVLFVCERDDVTNLLKNETRIYGELFEIQTLEEFFAQNQNTNRGSPNVETKQAENN